jgi:predicted metal-binding protein
MALRFSPTSPTSCYVNRRVQEGYGGYSSALLLVDEHDTSEVSDILEAWYGIRKDSFHKMLEIELEAFREGFTFAHLLRPGACNEC